MNTTTSGAVGFAPVGTFVKDLALELGKAPATLVAYLKKHLPTTLSKRKNANNRLANFVDGDGVQGLRAHYTPAVAPAIMVNELQRLRDENARLRERVQELEQAAERLETHLDVALETIDRHVTAREAAIEKTKALVAEANEQIEKSRAGEPARQEFLERINTDTQKYWRQANDVRKRRQ